MSPDSAGDPVDGRNALAAIFLGSNRHTILAATVGAQEQPHRADLRLPANGLEVCLPLRLMAALDLPSAFVDARIASMAVRPKLL